MKHLFFLAVTGLDIQHKGSELEFECEGKWLGTLNWWDLYQLCSLGAGVTIYSHDSSPSAQSARPDFWNSPQRVLGIEAGKLQLLVEPKRHP